MAVLRTGGASTTAPLMVPIRPVLTKDYHLLTQAQVPPQRQLHLPGEYRQSSAVPILLNKILTLVS